VVNVTPFEPEWEGYATVSIANTAPLPVRVYANEGIAQLIFLGADEICRFPMRTKKGNIRRSRRSPTPKLNHKQGHYSDL